MEKKGKSKAVNVNVNQPVQGGKEEVKQPTAETVQTPGVPPPSVPHIETAIERATRLEKAGLITNPADLKKIADLKIDAFAEGTVSKKWLTGQPTHVEEENRSKIETADARLDIDIEDTDIIIYHMSGVEVGQIADQVLAYLNSKPDPRIEMAALKALGIRGGSSATSRNCWFVYMGMKFDAYEVLKDLNAKDLTIANVADRQSLTYARASAVFNMKVNDAILAKDPEAVSLLGIGKARYKNLCLWYGGVLLLNDSFARAAHFCAMIAARRFTTRANQTAKRLSPDFFQKCAVGMSSQDDVFSIMVSIQLAFHGGLNTIEEYLEKASKRSEIVIYANAATSFKKEVCHFLIVVDNKYWPDYWASLKWKSIKRKADDYNQISREVVKSNLKKLKKIIKALEEKEKKAEEAAEEESKKEEKAEQGEGKKEIKESKKE